MKTLSNAELQDAIRYSTECVKNCLQKSNEYQLHLEHLVALLDEQKRRASERVELSLEPITTTIDRAEFDARVRAQDGPEWVEWGGVACPVFEDSIIDVHFRDGRQWDGVRAGDLCWAHDWLRSNQDITGYRNSAPAPRGQRK